MPHALIRTSMLAALIGVCGLLPARPAAAQDGDVRADALTTEAHRTAEDLNAWREAARLHREAGQLREKGDMRAYVSFVHAARLYYHAGELRDSERMFEAAGERALDVGDVYNAAVAFLNGAAVAEENGRGRQAQQLGWRAEELSRSSLLNTVQRGDLLRRYHVLESGS